MKRCISKESWFMTHESWIALGSICLVNGHWDRRSSHNQTYHWNKESCFHIFLLQCHYWELCQQFILPVHTKEELKAQILTTLHAVTNSSWALNDSMWENIISTIIPSSWGKKCNLLKVKFWYKRKVYVSFHKNS